MIGSKSKSVLMIHILFLISSPVFAYVGPGAGLTAIGSFLALVLAIVVTLVGFIWFPLKRLLGRNKQQMNKESEEEAECDKSES